MKYTDIFEEEKDFPLKEGSFGTVHKMHHKQWGYIRAIKVLRRIELSERDKTKFEQECKTLLQLSSGNHPNIVTIYNVHPEEEQPFFEMAWIEGENFDDISAGKYMEIDEVFRFISDIGNALAFCHNGGVEKGARGIVHNDLHPGNIIRSKVDGRYVLIDFGLAMEDTAQISSSLANVGAIEYISPERCDIQQFGTNSEFARNGATPTWDVYSFGCLIYQALTGMPPYQSSNRIKKYKLQGVGLTPTQMYCAHKREVDPNGSSYKIESILELREKLYEREHPGKKYSQKECPEWLVGLVMNCLEKEAPPRYSDAQEFMDDFNKLYQGEAKVPRRNYDDKVKELEKVEGDLNTKNETIDKLNVDLNQTKGELYECKELLNSFISPKRIYFLVATAVTVILAIFTNCWAVSIEPKDSSLIVNTYLLSGISILALLIVVYSEIQNSQKMKSK